MVWEWGSKEYALQVALEVGGAQNRLWLLKLASKRVSTVGLGCWAAKLGLGIDDLRTLIKDRAAQKGLLSCAYLIS